MPSRYQISNKLLNDEYESIKFDVYAKIKQASTVAIQCDGWSNIRNEAVINFIVTTPKPVLFKTMTTGAERHTGEYIAEELLKCIAEVGEEKIFAVVSDNATAMEKAKKIVTTKYPYVTGYSCAAHTINLLVEDIMKLQSLKNVESSCRALINEIRGSHINQATFNKIQIEKYGKVTSLKLPVKTRWGSILYCLNSLLITKQALQLLVISQDGEGIKLSKTTRHHILDNDVFWIRLEKIKSILEPIVKWITLLEGDSAKMSQVYVAVAEIDACIKTNVKALPVSSSEEKELITLFEKRKCMMLKPIHLSAYLLDPHYCGQELSNEQHVTAMQFIDSTLSNHPQFQQHKQTICVELTNYLAKSDMWSVDFVWQVASNTDSIAWWQGICNKTNLKDLAVAIIGLSPSSAATERSFSTYSVLHCKRRNLLTSERAGKLLYVSHNSKLLDGETSYNFNYVYDNPIPNVLLLGEKSAPTISLVNEPSTSKEEERNTSKSIPTVPLESDSDSESDSENECEISIHDSNSSIGAEEFSDLDDSDSKQK
ncbi:uncharacterized protein LOC116161248 [Photinus pyralis]|uniref:uncharacterized protein LOC116161248 n=1 Tax=Photinus pyralis TaxID=7054 RepID=UPI001267618A|nr:uncharacterized protein LOC116161248 [Photinus pyralis]